MKPIKKLMAKSGTYKDRQTGQDKNSYTRCGTLFYDESSGEYSIKIEALPVNFDGWINCWELDSQKVNQQNGLQQQNQSSIQHPPQGGQNAYQRGCQQSVPDDIPF